MTATVIATVAALALIIILSPFNSARQNDSQTRTQTTEDQKSTHYMEADYPVYQSFDQLVARSTLVVRGTVDDILPSFRVIPEGIPLDKLPAEKAANVGYMLTPVVVKIGRVLSGPSSLTKTTIVVTHLGGEDANDRYVAEGQPISRKGQSYVFFLEQSPQGDYNLVGGNQGRYAVLNGKLTALPGEGGPIARQLNGMSLTTFEKDFNLMVQASKPTSKVQEKDEAPASQEGLPSPANKPKGPPPGEEGQP
jgi:hypothetical protein